MSSMPEKGQLPIKLLIKIRAVKYWAKLYKGKTTKNSKTDN